MENLQQEETNEGNVISLEEYIALEHIREVQRAIVRGDKVPSNPEVNHFLMSDYIFFPYDQSGISPDSMLEILHSIATERSRKDQVYTHARTRIHEHDDRTQELLTNYGFLYDIDPTYILEILQKLTTSQQQRIDQDVMSSLRHYVESIKKYLKTLIDREISLTNQEEKQLIINIYVGLSQTGYIENERSPYIKLIHRRYNEQTKRQSNSTLYVSDKTYESIKRKFPISLRLRNKKEVRRASRSERYFFRSAAYCISENIMMVAPIDRIGLYVQIYS